MVEVAFNLFGEIADAFMVATVAAPVAIADKAVEHIQEHIIANGQVDTGNMLDSVHVEAGNDGVQYVTVGAEYGIYQNYGTRFLPARPFFEPGLDDTQVDIDTAMAGIVNAMAKAGR